MRTIKLSIICFVLLFVLPQCRNTNNSYEKLVQEELKSGKRVDSIFFDISFNMPSKKFFIHCWEMNKKGLFKDGVNNMYVLHNLNKGQLKHPASMNFYPDFYKDKIFRMRVEYQYDEWSPWNKLLHTDSLVKDVLSLYKRTYKTGNPFLTISDKKRGDIYVKVDGNRRITIGKFNDMIVKVDFTDLIIEEELNNAK